VRREARLEAGQHAPVHGPQQPEGEDRVVRVVLVTRQHAHRRPACLGVVRQPEEELRVEGGSELGAGGRLPAKLRREAVGHRAIQHLPPT
jgi:hypothetical protein